MGNKVFANGREISCKAAAGKTICAMPDVCFTPPENPATPPGVPVPYPNTGFASDTTKGSKNVKISKKEVGLKNKSCFKKSTGDEAGSAAKKGVITSQNRGKVYFESWSMDVKIEGQNVVRHLDITTNNHASTPGDTPPMAYRDSSTPASDEEEEKCPPHDFKCEPIKRKPKHAGKTKDERRAELNLGINEGDEFESRCSVHNDAGIQSGDDMGISFRCKKEGCGMVKEIDHVIRDTPDGPIKRIVQCKSDQSKNDPSKKGVKIKPKQVSADRDLRESLKKCQDGEEPVIEYKLEEGDAAEKAKDFLHDDILVTMVP